MLARNSLLARLAASAVSFARQQLCLGLRQLGGPRRDPVFQVLVHPGQLVLGGREVVHHRVEGAGELADLEGALDLRRAG